MPLPQADTVKYAIASLGCLQIIDAILTRGAVSAGVARELNPLLASMAGDWSFVVFKVAGAILSVVALLVVYRRFPKAAGAASTAAVSFYGLVLIWNLGAIFIP